MKVNVIRLRDDHLVHESLDTTLLFHIEFMLDDEHSVCVTIENGILYMSSPAGRLRITPRSSNAISVEVTE